jgi:hypothetical protein
LALTTSPVPRASLPSFLQSRIVLREAVGAAQTYFGQDAVQIVQGGGPDDVLRGLVFPRQRYDLTGDPAVQVLGRVQYRVEAFRQELRKFGWQETKGRLTVLDAGKDPDPGEDTARARKRLQHRFHIPFSSLGRHHRDPLLATPSCVTSGRSDAESRMKTISLVTGILLTGIMWGGILGLVAATVFP